MLYVYKYRRKGRNQRSLIVLQRGDNGVLSTLLFLDYAVPPDKSICCCLSNLREWGINSDFSHVDRKRLGWEKNGSQGRQRSKCTQLREQICLEQKSGKIKFSKIFFV